LRGAVRIGAVLSPEHVSARNGIALAQGEINAQGALGAGVTLQVLVTDDEGLPEPAINAVFQLINGDGVSAILGPALPFPVQQTAPIAQAARVPMLTLAATAPDVTAVGDFIFRVAPPDARVISQTISVARTRLGFGRAAILYDEDDGDMRAQQQAFAAALAAQGVTVVATEPFLEGDTDFTPALERAQAAGAQALVVVAFPAEAVLILAQAQASGLPVIGGTDFAAPNVAQAAGAATVLFGAPWCACAPGDANARFVAAYRALYNTNPDAQAAEAYSATWLLATAMQRAGNADRVAIRDALARLQNVATPLGAFTFDARREPAYAPYVLTVAGGEFVTTSP
jgi:branched-chain amino acid transport system substrate-binding protein